MKYTIKVLSVPYCSPIVEVEVGFDLVSLLSMSGSAHISGGNVADPSMYVFTTESANIIKSLPKRMHNYTKFAKTYSLKRIVR